MLSDETGVRTAIDENLLSRNPSICLSATAAAVEISPARRIVTIPVV